MSVTFCSRTGHELFIELMRKHTRTFYYCDQVPIVKNVRVDFVTSVLRWSGSCFAGMGVASLDWGFLHWSGSCITGVGVASLEWGLLHWSGSCNSGVCVFVYYVNGAAMPYKSMGCKLTAFFKVPEYNKVVQLLPSA